MLDSTLTPPPAPGAPAVHRLAEGTELLGEYQGSGLDVPTYLIRRVDGQVMQLPHLLYRVAASLNGRDDAALAADLSRQLGQELTADDVGFLVEERLRPVGIVAADGATAGPEVVLVRPDPLLALRFRIGIVPAGVVWRVAGLFQLFFRRPVWAAGLSAFVALLVAAVLRGGLVDAAVGGVTQVVQHPTLTLAMLGLSLASAVFHECGHVAACRYGGARPGDMGIGLYIVWPALYSTVTDSYRLGRVGRLRTDLGGVYFNALFIAGLTAVYLATGQPWLLLLVLGLLSGALWQFLPSIRLDGYYVLADLVGVPELFGYLRPVLRSLLPGRPADPAVSRLKPWSRRVIVGWVLAVVPTLGGLLVVFLLLLPRALPAAAAAVVDYGRGLQRAVRDGDVLTVVLGVGQFSLLLLPWIGTVLITVMIGGMLRRAAVARWGRGRVPAGTWSRVTRGLARSACAALLLLVLARVWQVAASLPASAREVGVTSGAFAAVDPRSAPVAVPGADLLVRQLVAGYAGLTGAFDRHADVLTGGREVALLATAVLLGCLLVLAARRRVRPLAVGLPTAGVLVMGPVVGLLAGVSAALVGAAWAAVGLLLLLRPHARPRHQVARRPAAPAVGLAALLVGVATCPVVVLPVAAAAAVAVGQGRVGAGLPRSARWTAVAGLLALGLGGALLGAMPGEPPPMAAADRAVLLLVAALVVVGGAAVGHLRPWAAAAGAAVLAGALPWAVAAAALPLVVVTVVPLGVLLVQALAGGPVAERPHPLVSSALAVPLLLVVVVGGLFAPAAAAPVAHAELAGWLAQPTAPTVPVEVPDRLWADLVRDGVPDERLSALAGQGTAGPGWAVVQGEVPPGPRVVARFGAGEGALTVLAPAAASADPAAAAQEAARRQTLGALLAANPRLDAPAIVREAVRTGEVDSRLLLVLAGLMGERTVSVGALPPVPGEDPAAAPPHALLVTGLDGRPAGEPAVAALLRRWLDAQRAPLAPASVATEPGGLLVQWSLPAPVPLLGG